MINSPSILDEHTVARVAEPFCSFSETSRVRILSAILGQEMNVSALAELIGVTESSVSHQIHGLRQMRIVQARRNVREVFYRVADAHIIALFQQGVRHAQE